MNVTSRERVDVDPIFRANEGTFTIRWYGRDKGLQAEVRDDETVLAGLQWHDAGCDSGITLTRASAMRQLPLRLLARSLEWLWWQAGTAPQLHLADDVRQLFGVPTEWCMADGTITSARFFQQPLLWYFGDNGGGHPLQWTENDKGVRHPQRRQFPSGLLYQRYLPSLDISLSFRKLDRNGDLNCFVNWMQQARVAEFWELNKSRDELAAYLDAVLVDPHLQPVIGCFDEQPFGYFEIYWAMEDRLGPYYEPQPFDRGAHVLVGEPKFLGKQYGIAWLNGLNHFLFLDDSRTQRLVGEPRADNAKLLKYLTLTSWKKIKEFDFPHKHAALLMCDREQFFQETSFA